MRMNARRATKVVARTTKPRSATTQTPHFAATRRDGCRDTASEAWGAGATALAPRLTVSLAAAMRPFPHHAPRDRVRGAFPGGLLCRSACEGGQPFPAPRFVHPIPESRRRNREGLNQRFLNRKTARNSGWRGWHITACRDSIATSAVRLTVYFESVLDK